METKNKIKQAYELAKKIYLTDTENSTYSFDEVEYDYCNVYSILNAMLTSLSKISENKMRMDMEKIEAIKWNTTTEDLRNLNTFKIAAIEHNLSNIKDNLINLDRLCRKYNYPEICGIKSNNNIDYFKFAIELQKEYFNLENFVIDILKDDESRITPEIEDTLERM